MLKMPEEIEKLIEKLRSGRTTLDERLKLATELGKLKNERVVPGLIEAYKEEENDSELSDGLWTERSGAHYLNIIGGIGGEQAKEYLFGLFQMKYKLHSSIWAVLKAIGYLSNKDNAGEIADFLIGNFNEGDKWTRERVNSFLHSYGESLVKYEDAREKLQDYAREKDDKELNKGVEIAIRKKYVTDLYNALRYASELETIVAASDKLCEMGYAWHAANELHYILLYDNEHMELKRRATESVKKSKLTLYPQARKRLWDYVKNSFLHVEDKPFVEEVRKILEENEGVEKK